MSKVKPKVLGTVTKSRRPKDPLAGFLDPADAIVPCKGCGASEGQPCRFTKQRPHDLDFYPQPGAVHFGRRLRRLLLTAARPHLREEFEKKAVEMLRDFLKEKAT